MKIKFVSSLIFVFCILSCKQKAINSANDQSQFQDSLKRILELNDSVKFLHIDTVQKNYVFIDFNKNSKYHTMLLEYRGNTIYEDEYNKEYNKQMAQFKDTIQNIAEDLRTKFYQLYKYEGELYVYLDCDFQMVYSITDTTFNAYGMEGAAPLLITRFEEKDKKAVIMTLSDTIEIEQISNTPAYKFKINNVCKYYTPRDKINNYNIIVHHCEDLTEDLIKFETIDCK